MRLTSLYVPWIRWALLMFSLIVLTGIVAAETPAAVVETAAPESLWQSMLKAIPWLDDFGKSLAEGLAANLAALLTGACAGIFVLGRKLLRKKWPTWWHHGTRTQTILMLGDSRTGKTTLIKALFGFHTERADGPDNQAPSRDLSLYGMMLETRTPRGSELCRFDVVDSRGSDPTQIMDWDILASKTYHAQPTTIILVIDLFDEGNTNTIHDNPAISRLQDHERKWTPDTFKMITKSVGDAPRDIILFVNKVDKLSRLTLANIVGTHGRGTRLTKVHDELTKDDGLVSNFQTAFGGRECKIIYGSALRGLGINELLAILQNRAQF